MANSKSKQKRMKMSRKIKRNMKVKRLKATIKELKGKKKTGA